MFFQSLPGEMPIPERRSQAEAFALKVADEKLTAFLELESATSANRDCA